MLLATRIPANSCGGIVAELGGVDYYFAQDDGEELVCEVADDSHVAVLLKSGNFYPANPADRTTARALLETVGYDDVGEFDDGEDFEEELIGSGAPVEGESASGKKTRKKSPSG